MQKNYKIFDNDIKNFISNPEMEKAYDLKYKEALFIRYMDESEDLTLEGLNILFNKYHNKDYAWCKNLAINDFRLMNSDANFTLGMRNFSEYVNSQNYDEIGIKHLDYKSAALILVPMLSYRGIFNDNYNQSTNYIYNIPVDDFYRYFKCSQLFDKVYEYNDFDFNNLTKKEAERKYDLKMALDYCCLADQVICDDNGYYSNMTNKYAKNQLEEYTKVYGDTPVEIVKEHVKSL